MTFMDKVYTLRTERKSVAMGKRHISSASRMGKASFTIWRYLSLSSWNFVKWSAKTVISNSPIGGIGRAGICGMKHSISGRSEFPKVLRN